MKRPRTPTRSPEAWREAWQPGWFGFSDDVWRKIAATVESGAIGTPTGPFPYRALLAAANQYWDNKFLPPEDRKNGLERIIELQLELRIAVAHVWDHLDKNLLHCLDGLESHAKYELAMLKLMRGPPKSLLYLQVLDCWGDAGGLFKVSRAKPEDGGKPYGPVIDYFALVVRNIMSEYDSAPGLEAIYQIIRKHKKAEIEMQAEIAKVEADIQAGIRRRPTVADATRELLDAANADAPGAVLAVAGSVLKKTIQEEARQKPLSGH